MHKISDRPRRYGRCETVSADPVSGLHNCMTVSLPQEKLNKLIEMASATLLHSKRSIREVAEVIGLIVSSFPAIKLARLHYRHLEFSKVNALKKEQQMNDFNAACSLSQETK